jgi:DNA repair exonuclease SbcCD nuclease subunit
MGYKDTILRRSTMKIIHCSDIHLDSALNTHLDAKHAEMRRNEILMSFQEMVEYAKNQGVRIIMIAGDLFDTQYISKKTKNIIESCIANHPEIDFLYLAGNHDEETFMQELKHLNNLKRFATPGNSYRYGDIVITGLVSTEYYDRLTLKSEDINIVMMHGIIENMTALAGRNIDYLALGHIHKYQKGSIDGRGTYCYSGCLEARGFDECGPKGFVVLDISSGHLVTTHFEAFGKRVAHEVKVDISAVSTTPQICSLIEAQLANVPKKDMVKVVLTGSQITRDEIDIDYIRLRYSNQWFAFKAENASGMYEDIEQLLGEISLRGAFLINVMNSNEDEATKKRMIEYGLKALDGEVVDGCI